MKIKVVVSVLMNGQSQSSKKNYILSCLKPNTTSKNKIMTIAATLPGVEKVSVEEEKNLLTVTGEDIDAVELVNIIRKKVGFATIVNQGPEPVEKKNEEKTTDKKEQKPADNNEQTVVINRVVPMAGIWEVRDPYYYNNNNSCFPFWW